MDRHASHSSSVVPVEGEHFFPSGFNQSPKEGSHWPSLGHRLILEPITVSGGCVILIGCTWVFDSPPGVAGVGGVGNSSLKPLRLWVPEKTRWPVLGGMLSRQKQKCPLHPSDL